MFLHTTPLRHTFSSYVLLAITCLITSGAAYAQSGGGIDTAGTGGRHSITGRLVFPSGQRADLRLRIRLETSGFGETSVLSDMNGTFTFLSLRPGNYSVVVEGGDYFETARESVFIEPQPNRRVVNSIPMSRPYTVHVYLRAKNTDAIAKAGVLNAALAGVPKQAAHLYTQAMESVAKGDNERSVQLLKEAVTLHPTFGLALNELGVLYSKTGDVERAGEAFRAAIQHSPGLYQPHLNYGIALLNRGKYADAESHMRAAVKKNESGFITHLYLGIVLAHLKHYPEAEAELQRSLTLAGGKLGQAHYYLGGIYWKVGEFKRAADELEKYLQLEPKAANAEKVRNTIKDLRTKS